MSIARSSLLQLPQEVLDNIIEQISRHQVIPVSMVIGKFLLLDSNARSLVRLPFVCRKLRRNASAVLSEHITLQLATYMYIPLLDPARCNPPS